MAGDACCAAAIKSLDITYSPVNPGVGLFEYEGCREMREVAAGSNN